MALTKNSPPTSREGVGYEYPMAAGAKIYEGALVALDAAGNAIPGNTVANGAVVVVGVAFGGKDNTGGAAGAETVEVRRGVFRFRNSAGGDAITAATVAGVEAELTDSTGGVVDGTLADVGAAFSQAVLNANFADLAAKVNYLLGRIGGTAYVVDDETVAKTDATGARIAAGTIRDVDAAGVWVEI